MRVKPSLDSAACAWSTCAKDINTVVMVFGEATQQCSFSHVRLHICLHPLPSTVSARIKTCVLDTVVNTHTYVTMRSPRFLRAGCVHVAIVACLAAAGVRSRAQTLFETIPQAECSASDLVGYDFKVTYACDVH